MVTYKKAKFIIDLKKAELIAKKVKFILQNVPNSKLFFSLKSQRDEKVISTISKIVDGFDASSFNEYIYIKKLFPKKKISVTGESMLMEEIIQIYNSGDLYNFSSLRQLKEFSEKYIKEVNIGIRLETDYYGRIMGIADNEEFFEFFLNNKNIKLVNIHVHHPQKYKNDVRSSIFKKILKIIQKFKKANVYIPQSINLGGGLDELYREKCMNTYLLEVNNFKKRYELISKLRVIIIFEPGELISRGISELYTSIIDVKEIKHNSYQLTVNSSKFILFPWYNPQLSITPTNITNGNSTMVNVKIYGFSNFSDDYYGEYMLPKKILNIGEELIFKNTGAYSMSMRSIFQLLEYPDIIYLE
ncbi:MULTISPECIES: hypothetical protein [Lactococcus]|nr:MULTISPECIES: hypothetical protein [Lactococcus]MCT0080517.1 hypothetical protein [Lactococcus lactis subsp. lactis]MCT0488439.1 hypothetical protein [Lactococcus cremoris]MDV4193267.1 hypothetical protein [Lactococcus lactis subsp. lactis]RXS49925.1 hypothetical protein ES032_13950 [Lactococcus lactis]